MTVDEALLLGARRLPRRTGIPDPRREARLLLAASWGVSESWLVARPSELLPEAVAGRFREWLERRAAGEPTEHLSGRCRFWGRELTVSPAVLVPRPETELVVAAALELPLPAAASVVDLGTGSGCIALSLSADRPAWRVTAVDRSPAAAALARVNLRAAGTSVLLCVGDLASALRGPFDLVVANLPYIPTATLGGLPVELRREPRLALDGGDDGLALLRRLLVELPRLLAAGGWAVLELGEDQADAVAAEAAAHGLVEHDRLADAGGCERVLVLRCE